MATISWKAANQAVELAMNAGSVPVVVGEAGIGKSAMMRKIAKDNNMLFYTIEGNLLKEGEVTGMPIASDNKEVVVEKLLAEKGIMKDEITVDEVRDMDPEYQDLLVQKELAMLDKDREALKEIAMKLAEINKNAIKKAKNFNKKALIKYQEEKNKLSEFLPDLTTEYATFGTLARIAIDLMDPANEGRDALLFVDEINRCEHAVLQELMNLILNREINGYKMDPRIKLVAAANPSARWSDFKDSEYQVTDPDNAQEDRLTWLFVEADEKQWLDWATSFDEETGIQNIHEDVVEFIATNADFLHQVRKGEAMDDVLPTPRSWERVSKAYTVYKESSKKYGAKDFYNVISGDVGIAVSIAFTQFIKDKKNPLIKAEEIFSVTKAELPEEITERISKEPYPRKLTILRNCMKWLSTNKLKKNSLDLFIDVLNCCTAELRVSVMSDILNNYKNLHKKLIDKDEYLDMFHDLDALV